MLWYKRLILAQVVKYSEAKFIFLYPYHFWYCQNQKRLKKSLKRALKGPHWGFPLKSLTHKEYTINYDKSRVLWHNCNIPGAGQWLRKRNFRQLPLESEDSDILWCQIKPMYELDDAIALTQGAEEALAIKRPIIGLTRVPDDCTYWLYCVFTSLLPKSTY